MKEVEDDEVLISAFSQIPTDMLPATAVTHVSNVALNKTDGRLKQLDAVVDLGPYHVCLPWRHGVDRAQFYCFFVECQLPGLVTRKQRFSFEPIDRHIPK